MESPEFFDNFSWYCVHSKPKTEHIAAHNIRQLEGVTDVFCPRIRYQKNTRRGRIWFREALFPGYFFARFPMEQVRGVQSRAGVLRVLKFGDFYPVIPEDMLAGLRENVGDEEIVTLETSVEIGQQVEVTSGPFRGFWGEVMRLSSGKQRVLLLMEFLGRVTHVEVKAENIHIPVQPRHLVIGRTDVPAG